jgi:hypothetical protein
MPTLNELITKFGKGPGFIFLGFIQVVGVLMLVAAEKDIGNLPMALAAINGPLYAAGAWKGVADAKNGRK